MDLDQSGDHGDRSDQDTSRLRDSVSMVIRQLQQPQTARAHSDEIPESDEGEVENHASGESDSNDNLEYETGDQDDLDRIPPRRPSVSSDGSHYNPSVASSEPDLALPDDHSSLRAEPNTQEHFFPPQTPKRPLSPYSTVPPPPSHWSSPRNKRSRSPSPRPLKRLKPTPFNHAYLALLNEDILDASARFTSQDANDNDAHPLPPSQIGLAAWTAPEKALLFSALARLGADDPARVAARVRTKSALEVAAYLSLLRDAAARREAGALVVPADVPAAVELSQACCAALEEAADAVAARQEAHEEGVEKGRGTMVTGRQTEEEEEEEEEKDGEGGMKSGALFRVRAWLGLSERVFMNASVDEYNWDKVAGGASAVRATALEDFYALAVEVTRRLVAATIFVGEARVKARRQLYPDARKRVWIQDVEAAALSLGLPTNSRQFWAKCARRLRLDVYDVDNGDLGGWDGEGEQAPMSYDEVERALGLELESTETPRDGESDSEEEEEEDQIDDEMESVSGSDQGSVELGAGTTYADELEAPLPRQDKAEKGAIKREMNEILVHSALEYPKSGTARGILRNRIRAEREHEAYADELDARASYYEEKRLWAMLDRQPPMELARPDISENAPTSTKRGVDELIEGFSRKPGDWRSKLEAFPSSWEMEYALSKEEKARPVAGTESGNEI
ncbi:hypothetical protein NEMBOFW57_007504 [Staphylotrichum longicolle]|uniref:Myb-like domain-containing protein n=1 Tax=Staphylotrichum longicolle TaxID=669026 RepID=A0AAD4EUW7_9PEZI|nr:hypothetical protein NEMBOFW57_007504 [Staphylotrichum longicolle]